MTKQQKKELLKKASATLCQTKVKTVKAYKNGVIKY